MSLLYMSRIFLGINHLISKKKNPNSIECHVCLYIIFMMCILSRWLLLKRQLICNISPWCLHLMYITNRRQKNLLQRAGREIQWHMTRVFWYIYYCNEKPWDSEKTWGNSERYCNILEWPGIFTDGNGQILRDLEVSTKGP